MRLPLVPSLLLVALLAPLGCAPEQRLPDAGSVVERDAGDDVPREEDAGPTEPRYPPPRSDLVARVGTALTLDIATWNIENFPLASTTPALVADLITSLDLDVVAIQEVRDTDAFEELADRLPRHRGILSPHTYGDGTYQKLGFLYREDLVSLTGVTTIFQGSGYQFPRPPLQGTLQVLESDLDFTILTVHLKAGLGEEDKTRRAASVELLADHMNALIDGPGDDDVLLLGDLNDTVTVDNRFGRERLAPLLEDDAFRFQTEGIANQGALSFLPSRVMLDHIVSSASLDDEVQRGIGPKVPDLHLQLPSYRSQVSDHLPVVISLPMQ